MKRTVAGISSPSALVAVAPQLERNFADGSTPTVLFLSLPPACLLSFSLPAYATVTSTLSISPKADANEHMEVTWKYDVKSVGGKGERGRGCVFIPATEKPPRGHVDLTGECDGDIYPASQTGLATDKSERSKRKKRSNLSFRTFFSETPCRAPVK